MQPFFPRMVHGEVALCPPETGKKQHTDRLLVLPLMLATALTANWGNVPQNEPLMLHNRGPIPLQMTLDGLLTDLHCVKLRCGSKYFNFFF